VFLNILKVVLRSSHGRFESTTKHRPMLTGACRLKFIGTMSYVTDTQALSHESIHHRI
jgi:hypothetical protein